jgi:hypothetical protein
MRHRLITVRRRLNTSRDYNEHSILTLRIVITFGSEGLTNTELTRSFVTPNASAVLRLLLWTGCGADRSGTGGEKSGR